MKPDPITVAFARLCLAAVSRDVESVRDELIELTKNHAPAEIATWIVVNIGDVNNYAVRKQTELCRRIVEAASN